MGPRLPTPSRSHQIDMFDRRMAQKFTETQAAEDFQQVSSPSRPGTRQHIGPSRIARLENYKKERHQVGFRQAGYSRPCIFGLLFVVGKYWDLESSGCRS